MLTLNGSKIYGPKGVGLLFVKSGIALTPLIHGGGQEFGFRSGTENVPGIVGLAKALELCCEEKDKEVKRLTKLRDYFVGKVLAEIPEVKLNGHPTKRLPNNINLSFAGIEGEALLTLLNEKGIFVSTGSACSSKSLEESHVLKAIGLPILYSHGSIRISMGRYTKKADLDYVFSVLKESVQKLRELSPFAKNG
jgi:cysteine desulfurase